MGKKTFFIVVFIGAMIFAVAMLHVMVWLDIYFNLWKERLGFNPGELGLFSHLTLLCLYNTVLFCWQTAIISVAGGLIGAIVATWKKYGK